MKSFKPPADWPHARAEDNISRIADALVAALDRFPLHDKEAAALARDAHDLLFRVYHVEMEARLAYWRSLGYPL